MKYLALTLALSALAGAASAGDLSKTEADALRAEIDAMTTAFERGEADLLIERTHPSVQQLAGGPEAFATAVRESAARVREAGIKPVRAEMGTPTKTYAAGEEEVCFVPRISVLEAEGKRAKATTFMVAIRRLGSKQWKFLDGSGLRRTPELLYQLLPKLERNITLPPNAVELCSTESC